jgi:hypothetical protein
MVHDKILPLSKMQEMKSFESGLRETDKKREIS